MPSLELLLCIVMMVSLTFYALLAGADYGGGVWALLASGPRALAQRELVAKAIAPIWEANHVWLILVVVVFFTAFAPAYALISTALHVALLFVLLGIILRGSAFIFRTNDTTHSRGQWGRIFAFASLFTPILLGAVVGAISSGSIRPPVEHATLAYFFTWVAPFPFAVGGFALVLFALLAAVYLTLETDDVALQNDFRRRAMACEVLAPLMAALVFVLSQHEAPAIREHLANSWWAPPLQVATALAAVSTLAALWARRFLWARFCAAGQVTLILWGWALAQYPYLVRPDLTIHNSAAPQATMRALLWALAAGVVLLFPSYWYLFHVFKGSTQTAPVQHG